MRHTSAILKGIAGAVSVFLLGFAMMLLLWTIIGNPNNLPGLFYYRAATIGDGICLPILIGSGIAFLQVNKSSSNNRRNSPIFVLAVASCIIATVIQASWLLRDDTVLNWSILVQHHFNIAGWYHSLFFIGMFGVSAYLFGCIWKIMKHKKQENSQWDYALFIFLFQVLCSFLCM